MAENCPDQWSLINLDLFLSEAKDMQRLHLQPLYKRVIETPDLYLKYAAYPKFQAIDSEISLPRGNGKETDNITYGLFPASDGAAEFSVVFFHGQPQDFTLTPGNGVTSMRVASDPVPLKIALHNNFDSPKFGRCNLLIAIPKKGLLFRIPVIILPVVHSGAANGLGFVILTLHFFPVILAWFIYKDFYPPSLPPGRSVGSVDQ